jgi:predicted small secreted protein
MHHRPIRAARLVLLLALAAVGLAACNTVAGVGEDLSAAGHAVSKGADKVRQGI